MTQVAKICPGCQRIFAARRDAKTCSPRCRKRYQRLRTPLGKTLALSREKSLV